MDCKAQLEQGALLVVKPPALKYGDSIQADFFKKSVVHLRGVHTSKFPRSSIKYSLACIIYSPVLFFFCGDSIKFSVVGAPLGCVHLPNFLDPPQ